MEAKIFVIPVTWKEQGQFIVRANSLADAVRAVENDTGHFNTGAANGEYIDCSFEIDHELVKEINESELEECDDLFTDLTLVEIGTEGE